MPWQSFKKHLEDISRDELPWLFNATCPGHVWSKNSQGMCLEVMSQVLLARLQSCYCPVTHEAMMLSL